MRKELVVLVIIAIALIGVANAAKYMYVKASVTPGRLCRNQTGGE